MYVTYLVHNTERDNEDTPLSLILIHGRRDVTGLSLGSGSGARDLTGPAVASSEDARANRAGKLTVLQQHFSSFCKTMVIGR